MIALYVLLAILGLVLSVTLFNVLTAPLVSRGPKPLNTYFVSLLIPCRNEANNIATCVSHLLQQDYSRFEVLVLDDQSDDDTAAIVRSFAKQDGRVRLLKGQSLPDGWTGKNWACHQLSRQATGEFLIFTDADNFFSTDAVSKTVGWMEAYQLDLFSAFPQQITATWSEKWVVSFFDLTVYALLPLWLTYRSSFPSLAAANGQWLAIRKGAYERLGGHEAVRQQVVEDVELARRSKQLGMSILTASGRDAVQGRMYRSLHEVWSGFAKNAFGLMGFRPLPFMIFLLLLFLLCILPYGLVFVATVRTLALVMVAMNVLIRGLVALKFKQPVWHSMVFHPLAIVLVLALAIHSMISFYHDGVVWKGRRIKWS
jgi:chlorobactene glucosyltransferase